jgi:hypothetical protein
VSQAVGPLLGGALIVLIGLGGMLGVDLATVVVSLATLVAARFPNRPRHGVDTTVHRG